MTRSLFRGQCLAIIFMAKFVFFLSLCCFCDAFFGKIFHSCVGARLFSALACLQRRLKLVNELTFLDIRRQLTFFQFRIEVSIRKRQKDFNLKVFESSTFIIFNPKTLNHMKLRRIFLVNLFKFSSRKEFGWKMKPNEMKMRATERENQNESDLNNIENESNLRS